MNGISLISGLLPVALLVLGGCSLVWLGWGSTRHVRTVLPAAAGAAGVLTLALFLLAEKVFHWWDASLPRHLYLYAGLGIFAVILSVPRLVAASGQWSRVLTVAAAGLVVAAVASSINTAYGQYPSVGSLVDPTMPQSGNLPERNPAAAAGLPASTEATWTPPAGMPAGGSVYSVEIPGDRSGYKSKPALIYLPPAYLAEPAAVNLPVLVLIHGQPGSPNDWLVGGDLAAMMDAFAAEHAGLAPVVVMPDASNADNAHWPLCLDSAVSKSATYLALDLPAWVQQHLASGLDGGRQWAVAGYSYGGTCAMQLAANFPAVYPTFIDISGETEPMIEAGRSALIDAYFNGDAAAFARQNALDLLAAQTFPNSAGIVVAGTDDAVYAPQARTVFAAAQAAGMDVTFQELPGGHSWEVWQAGLSQNLNWLGGRLGILAG